ncbi:TPA: ATP-binding protein, partial [Listeria monocytogenes]|nr:ATP-binding protein [Listeria monocytogenes]
EYVKEELLPGILKDRSFYSELLKAGKKEKEIKQQKKKEEELKEKSIGFKRDVTREMTSEISKISTINKDEVESIVNTQVNKHMKSL